MIALRLDYDVTLFFILDRKEIINLSQEERVERDVYSQPIADCEQCGVVFYYSPKATRRPKFCSNACKMKAYRRRLKRDKKSKQIELTH